jgi:hypothetical protein
VSSIRVLPQCGTLYIPPCQTQNPSASDKCGLPFGVRWAESGGWHDASWNDLPLDVWSSYTDCSKRFADLYLTGIVCNVWLQNSLHFVNLDYKIWSDTIFFLCETTKLESRLPFRSERLQNSQVRLHSIWKTTKFTSKTTFVLKDYNIHYTCVQRLQNSQVRLHLFAMTTKFHYTCVHSRVKTLQFIHGHRTLKAPHPVRSAQLTRVPPS